MIKIKLAEVSVDLGSSEAVVEAVSKLPKYKHKIKDHILSHSNDDHVAFISRNELNIALALGDVDAYDSFSKYDPAKKSFGTKNMEDAEREEYWKTLSLSIAQSIDPSADKYFYSLETEIYNFLKEGKIAEYVFEPKGVTSVDELEKVEFTDIEKAYEFAKNLGDEISDYDCYVVGWKFQNGEYQNMGNTTPFPPVALLDMDKSLSENGYYIVDAQVWGSLFSHGKEYVDILGDKCGSVFEYAKNADVGSACTDISMDVITKSMNSLPYIKCGKTPTGSIFPVARDTKDGMLVVTLDKIKDVAKKIALKYPAQSIGKVAVDKYDLSLEARLDDVYGLKEAVFPEYSFGDRSGKTMSEGWGAWIGEGSEDIDGAGMENDYVSRFQDLTLSFLDEFDLSYEGMFHAYTYFTDEVIDAFSKVVEELYPEELKTYIENIKKETFAQDVLNTMEIIPFSTNINNPPKLNEDIQDKIQATKEMVKGKEGSKKEFRKGQKAP